MRRLALALARLEGVGGLGGEVLLRGRAPRPGPRVCSSSPRRPAGGFRVDRHWMPGSPGGAWSSHSGMRRPDVEARATMTGGAAWPERRAPITAGPQAQPPRAERLGTGASGLLARRPGRPSLVRPAGCRHGLAQGLRPGRRTPFGSGRHQTPGPAPPPTAPRRWPAGRTGVELQRVEDPARAGRRVHARQPPGASSPRGRPAPAPTRAGRGRRAAAAPRNRPRRRPWPTRRPAGRPATGRRSRAAGQGGHRTTSS